MNLYFKSYGKGCHHIIILHGLLGSQANWFSISERLGQHFKVYTVDLRNHGDSPHSPDFNYLVMVEDLRCFIEGHSLSKATILGHSLGGTVGMKFASVYPDMVDRLIIEDISPRQYARVYKEIFEELLALDLEKVSRRSDVVDALEKKIPDLSLRHFLTKNLIVNARGQFGWKPNLKGIYKNLDQLNKGDVMERPLTTPTVFFRGKRSEFITEKDRELIKRWFPQSEIITFENSGHWIHVDEPEEFTRKILDFVLEKDQ